MKRRRWTVSELARIEDTVILGQYVMAPIEAGQVEGRARIGDLPVSPGGRLW